VTGCELASNTVPVKDSFTHFCLTSSLRDIWFSLLTKFQEFSSLSSLFPSFAVALFAVWWSLQVCWSMPEMPSNEEILLLRNVLTLLNSVLLAHHLAVIPVRNDIYNIDISNTFNSLPVDPLLPPRIVEDVNVPVQPRMNERMSFMDNDVIFRDNPVGMCPNAIRVIDVTNSYQPISLLQPNLSRRLLLAYERRHALRRNESTPRRVAQAVDTTSFAVVRHDITSADDDVD
jgi:hypothetical protein